MLAELYQKYLSCSKVSTDTRNITGGELFFALKGPNFNGNQYAQKALEQGAKFAVVDEIDLAKNEQYILVKDGLKALQLLANHHRKQLNLPVFAITGSNGKTTTKELCHAVLSSQKTCFATKGNFNNHIGVPLTLLELPQDAEFALIEMGDNQLGDVTELCKIAEPTHGIITNIGKDHIEGFGSFEGNVRAKSELYHYLIENKGVALIHSPDPILKNMSKRFDNPIFYGSETDFSNLTFVQANPFIHYQNEAGKLIQTKLIGHYNFENIQVAACVGKYFGILEGNIHKAIANYSPSNNRSQVVYTEQNTLILDAYNANPSSVEMALRSFANMQSELRKLVILGDMLELGAISALEHQNMVDLVHHLGLGGAFFCGEAYSNTDRKTGKFFASRNDLSIFLKGYPQKNCIVLLKGSRGIALEKLQEVL